MRSWQQIKAAVFLFFGVGVLLWVAYHLRHALLLLYVAALLAVLLSPIVQWIRRRRIRGWQPSRGAAIIIMLGGGLLLVAAFAVFAVPPIAADAHNMQQQLPQRLAEAAQWIRRYLPFGHGITAATLASYLHRLQGNKFSPDKILEDLIALATTLLVTAYFILDGEVSVRWLVRLFPTHEQPRIEATLKRGAHRAQRWLSGQAILMLIHGVSATIVFGLLKVKYFYALGLFAGVINIIPVLGPVITVVVAGVIAAIDSTTKMIGVIVFFLVYHNVENAFVGPRVMESKVHIPAVTVVVALVIGEAFAGIVGILISVPSAVLFSVLIEEYLASGPTVAQRPDLRKVS